MSLGELVRKGVAMRDSEKTGISRREFARRMALASAGASAAAMGPVGLVGASALTVATAAVVPEWEQAAQGPALPKLTAEGQAEAAGRVQMILGQYGGRFSEAQKADLQRLSVLAQPQLERVRGYAVENGDGTALYLKPLMEHEKKPGSVKAGEAGKKQ